ncbi:MAG: serine hydrolase, partial [Gammaproteobacteria bacterium]|nr:serine hydrolase [Gammaproteobacteria bacterium]
MQIDATAAGMSTERLSRISDHLNERFIKPGKIAGALPLVYRKGQLAYCEPLGSMDLERGKGMTEDTIFRIYSMSKPITSVALMMLYEQGAFQLNDPVTRFIPEWHDIQVYAAGVAPSFMTTPVERPMFIRDLFTHMSGLTYGFMNRSNVDHAYRKMGIGGVEPGTTLTDTIEILAKIPLEFSPGTRWNYSVSTDVLGYLVEVISGQRFDEYLHQ